MNVSVATRAGRPPRILVELGGVDHSLTLDDAMQLQIELVHAVSLAVNLIASQLPAAPAKVATDG